MRRSVGFLSVSAVVLAFSCGKSGGGDSDPDDAGSGGKPVAGASAAGAGGRAGGAGQAPGGGSATGGSGAGAGNAGSGNATTAGGAGGKAGSSSGSPGAGGTTDPGGGDGGMSEAGGAGAPSGSGELTMFVMFDRSWSMLECGDGTPSSGTGTSLDCPTVSRWDMSAAALIQFFQAPEAAGLNVALRFFPHDDPAVGCDGYVVLDGGADVGPNCDPVACSQPLVDAAPLLEVPAPTDTHEAALVAAVAASPPPGPEAPNPQPGTPTWAALGGAEQWAIAYRQAHPGAPTAVVLVTDGEPTGCNTELADICDLAATARNEAGVLTYVIGLSGSNEQSLSMIAAAGGTEEAFFVSDGDSAVEDLFAALSTIRAGGR